MSAQNARLQFVHFTNASGGIFPAALASTNILAAASKFQLKQKWSVNLIEESFFEEISVEPVLHKAFARPLNVHPRLLGEFDSHRLRRIVKSDGYVVIISICRSGQPAERRHQELGQVQKRGLRLWEEGWRTLVSCSGRSPCWRRSQ